MPNINTLLLGLLGVFWALIAALFGVVYQGIRRERDDDRRELHNTAKLIEDHLHEDNKEFRLISDRLTKIETERSETARRTERHSEVIEDVRRRLDEYEKRRRNGDAG